MTPEALITYTSLGVPSYHYSIIYPQTLLNLDQEKAQDMEESPGSGV